MDEFAVNFGMRRDLFAITVGTVLCIAFSLPAIACAQGNEIIELRPLRARHLSGAVTDPNGVPILGAIIEDCDSTYHSVIASTKTDTNGRFSFENIRNGSQHYLSVRYPNFDLLHVKVTIRTFAKSSLHFQLHMGT